MKNAIRFYLSTIALYGFIAVTLVACDKRAEQQARMTVKMTDAPANYLAVNVDVIGMSVNTAGGGWIDLPVQAGVYDLLQLQDSVTVVLANNVVIPTGRINQVRLLLGPNNSIITTAGTFPLTIPSGQESGLKINVNYDIINNANVIMVLDFDAGASVVENGNGSFSLKPVIKVLSITQ